MRNTFFSESKAHFLGHTTENRLDIIPYIQVYDSLALKVSQGRSHDGFTMKLWKDCSNWVFLVGEPILLRLPHAECIVSSGEVSQRVSTLGGAIDRTFTPTS